MSRRSQLIRQRIKSDGVEPGAQPPVFMIEAVVRQIEARGGPELAALLSPDAVLVPVPRSAPFPPGQPTALWVPRRIAEALVAKGHGRRVEPMLVRTTAVQKSAFAEPGCRPTPQRHLESMALRPTLDVPNKILVVDDIVTKGATLLGAASLVSDAFPHATVAAFALMRTLGLQRDIAALVAPVVGTIAKTQGDGADRSP